MTGRRGVAPLAVSLVAMLTQASDCAPPMCLPAAGAVKRETIHQSPRSSRESETGRAAETASPRAETPTAPASAPTAEPPRPQQSATPPESVAPPQSAPPQEGAAPRAGAQEESAPLDLKSLETRLRETKAIGIFTKLSLKNQVDDLLEQFRGFHQGRDQATLAKLRQAYDLLLLKVLSLLQDGDPALARDIARSREALWSLLADPDKFRRL